MRPDTWPRIRSLFEAALELEPERRDDFLARECAFDAEVQAEVRALLSADATDATATSLVEADPGTALAGRDLVGCTFAGFAIQRLIGIGGMGAVYEAQQQRPQRAVALKALAVRFPSERARRRFEDEADILARLRHPAIAQVLAAGSARVRGADVPWFAMELVEQPRTIERFVREQALDARGIVALFMTVCEAVHYAHQRGVIHRDLKPANVLVDGRGQVKVIDFGIARLLHRDAGTRFTTVVALDVLPGVPTSGPRDLTPAVGRLFFTAQTPTSGRDLWSTDGSAIGTLDLGIAAGTATSRPAGLTALGARCFLAATDASGEEPWVSDGTLAGTVRLADLAPGNASSGPSSFAALGARMFFSAQTPTVGRELFVSDGTPAGSVLFADLWPGTTGSQASDLVACPPLLFFRAAAQGAGTELWVSDGSVAGTRMLPEIVVGTGSPAITDMVGVPGRLFFFAADLQRGRELWTSDGTVAGTRLVVDLMPGLGHGVQPGSLTRLPGTQLVAFVGSDAIDRLQLWRSDGTAAGTSRLGRMGSLPGSGASVTENLGVAGERLFFRGGVDDASGHELWAIGLSGLGLPFTASYGDGQCPGTGSLEPRITAFGLPQLGNASFAIDVFDARPLSPAFVQLGAGQVDLPFGVCRLLVAPLLLSLPPIVTNAAGGGRTPLPIPSSQALGGARVFAQYAVVDPSGPLLGALALSDGLVVQLGR